MDFRDQRAGDLYRAQTRGRALEAGRKTRGLLDRYVSSRRLPVSDEPVTEILWGRIAATLAAIGLIIAGAVHLIR